MQMQTWMLLFIIAVSPSAIAGPVYRCQGTDGVTRFTDRGCPGRGEKIEPSALKPNVYTPEPIAELNIETPMQEETETQTTGCNNADDLRHIDLMLKSLTTDKEQRRFLKAERKRVVNCQLASLSPADREKRDAALRRTRSLRDSTRAAAELEIQSLYGIKQPGKRERKRR